MNLPFRRQFKRDVTNADDWESEAGGSKDIGLTEYALTLQSKQAMPAT